MFGWIKRQLTDWVTDKVDNTQAAMAEKVSVQASVAAVYAILTLSGALAVFLVLLSGCLYLGWWLGSYLYGLFIFSGLFVLLFIILWAFRLRIGETVRLLVLEALQPESAKTPPLVVAEVVEEEEVKKLVDKR